MAVARDVASGVEYLHKEKVIHRDLKPENIVLQPQGNSAVVSGSIVACVVGFSPLLLGRVSSQVIFALGGPTA